MPLPNCACPLQNKLGGGEGVEGLYGSIKRSGMDKVRRRRRMRKACRDGRLEHRSLACTARVPECVSLSPNFLFTQQVLECMRAKCGLDAASVLVDIGAGLGRCGCPAGACCGSVPAP